MEWLGNRHLKGMTCELCQTDDSQTCILEIKNTLYVDFLKIKVN